MVVFLLLLKFMTYELLIKIHIFMYFLTLFIMFFHLKHFQTVFTYMYVIFFF